MIQFARSCLSTDIGSIPIGARRNHLNFALPDISSSPINEGSGHFTLFGRHKQSEGGGIFRLEYNYLMKIEGPNIHFDKFAPFGISPTSLSAILLRGSEFSSSSNSKWAVSSPSRSLPVPITHNLLLHSQLIYISQ